MILNFLYLYVVSNYQLDTDLRKSPVQICLLLNKRELYGV